MEVPLEDDAMKMVGGILPLPGERRAAGTSVGRIREASLLAEALDELGHPTQAVEVKQVGGVAGERGSRGIPRRVVGGADSDGGMVAIRQPDDDVGMLTVADADHQQLLPTEGMRGMRDRHEARREVGRRGSALGMCPRSRTAWRSWRQGWSWRRFPRPIGSRSNTRTGPGAAQWRRFAKSRPCSAP